MTIGVFNLISNLFICFMNYEQSLYRRILWYGSLIPRLIHLELSYSYTIRYMYNHITVIGMWGSWSKWSKCSVSCGVGKRSRSRPCTDSTFNDNSCSGSNSINDEQPCNTSSCLGMYMHYNNFR